jgi:serine/threonine protein kinase
VADFPSQVAGYEIVRRLGAGTMSNVYMASGGGNVYYAVKVLKPHLARPTGDARRFVREIVHDNLLQYRNISESDSGEDVFVSDYLEVRPAIRKTLRTTLSDETLELYASCADALETMHTNGVIHGNVKTSNVFVRRPGPREVMGIVGDPGIEYHYDNKEEWTPEMIRDVFAYMAPERIRQVLNPDGGEEVGPAADIYSLCASLVESLAGRQIFTEAETPDQMIEVKARKSFRLLNVNYPTRHVDVKPLNELVARNLSVDPAKRMQSMTELAEGLRACKIPEEEKTSAL